MSARSKDQQGFELWVLYYLKFWKSPEKMDWNLFRKLCLKWCEVFNNGWSGVFPSITLYGGILERKGHIFWQGCSGNTAISDNCSFILSHFQNQLMSLCFNKTILNSPVPISCNQDSKIVPAGRLFTHSRSRNHRWNHTKNHLYMKKFIVRCHWSHIRHPGTESTVFIANQ